MHCWLAMDSWPLIDGTGDPICKPYICEVNLLLLLEQVEDDASAAFQSGQAVSCCSSAQIMLQWVHWH